VLGALATLGWWGLGGQSTWGPSGGGGVAASDAPSPRSPAAGGGSGDPAGGARAGSVYQGELPPLAASLAGTDVDGDLGVDGAGRFAPGPEALQLFDYFLSAQGEEPLSVIRARIHAEIESRLPESVREEARIFFEDYLDYLREMGSLDPIGPGADEMEGRLASLERLRQEHFGAELAETLFADEEKRARLSIERRRILDDSQLSDRERIEALADLQRQLPEHVREAEREAHLPLRLAMAEDRLRAEGAGEGEIRALRERMLGPEAAERMDQLDRQRRIWERRVEAYRRERDAVLDEIADADEPTRARFIRNVRERHFAPDELPRVEALDRIEARQQGQAAVPRSRTLEERERGAASSGEEPAPGAGAPLP